MQDLRLLIREYPELGDVLAEIHTELSYLHNSMPNTSPEAPELDSKPEQWKPKQWDRLQQLEGRILHLENKVMEIRSIRAKGKFKTYD